MQRKNKNTSKEKQMGWINKRNKEYAANILLYAIMFGIFCGCILTYKVITTSAYNHNIQGMIRMFLGSVFGLDCWICVLITFRLIERRICEHNADLAIKRSEGLRETAGDLKKAGLNSFAEVCEYVQQQLRFKSGLLPKEYKEIGMDRMTLEMLESACLESFPEEAGYIHTVFGYYQDIIWTPWAWETAAEPYVKLREKDGSNDGKFSMAERN